MYVPAEIGREIIVEGFALEPSYQPTHKKDTRYTGINSRY